MSIRDTTTRRVVTFGPIAALMIVLSLAFPSASLGQVYWEDDFENHLNAGGVTPWDTSACYTYGGALAPTPVNPAPDGCSPRIVTDTAHSGTHSLRSHYDTPCMQSVAPDCGRYIDRYHPLSNEVWMRWYTRWLNCNDPSSCVNPYVGSKQMYNKADPGYEIVWHIWPGQTVIGGQNSHNGYYTDCTAQEAANAGVDAACNFPANMNTTAVNLFDGQWHCVETHVNSGTIDTLDGVIETWHDGIQTMRYTKVAFKGSGQPTGPPAPMGRVTHFAQHGGGDRYIDDLAVGSTRIGCSGVRVQTPSTPSATTLR